VYLAFSTYNTEFMALVISTMNLVQREFLLCEWSSFGLSDCCLGWADRDDSFYGKIFDVNYSTFLISFENETQFSNLG